MITIAVCDSEARSREQLRESCERLRQELHLPISCQTYSTGEELLAQMTPNVDIILLEEALSGISGLETARRIRENNTSVLILFVTGDLACAAETYRVRAADFIPKPASHREIAQALTGAIQALEQGRGDHVTFHTPGQWVRLPMHSILYVESARNKAVIHTVVGRYELYTTMKEIGAGLDPKRFFRCHSGFIINLANVVRVNELDAVLIDGSVVSISKYRKKEFLACFTRLTGGEMVQQGHIA